MSNIIAEERTRFLPSLPDENEERLELSPASSQTIIAQRNVNAKRHWRPILAPHEIHRRK
jgi:hypothetical protein